MANKAEFLEHRRRTSEAFGDVDEFGTKMMCQNCNQPMCYHLGWRRCLFSPGTEYKPPPPYTGTVDEIHYALEKAARELLELDEHTEIANIVLFELGKLETRDEAGEKPNP